MKGLIFTRNVGAILSGQKTLTRRIIKAEIADWVKTVALNSIRDLWLFNGGDWKRSFEESTRPASICPYQPGELRYIKERWRTLERCDDQAPSELMQSYDPIQYSDLSHDVDYSADEDHFGKWRSPLFMCKWMSRGTVKITSVGAERVQDITDADIVEEGITYQGQIGLRNDWVELWDEIYGPGAWERNDWVWRVGMEVVQ